MKVTYEKCKYIEDKISDDSGSMSLMSTREIRSVTCHPLTHNKETGEFFDPSKLHTLSHHGNFFSVQGPLNIARSPQGQPVIFQTGASEDGMNFAAKRADAIFVGHNNIDGAKTYYRDLKGRAAAFGRDPETVLILPGIRPALGRTGRNSSISSQSKTPCACSAVRSTAMVLRSTGSMKHFPTWRISA